MKQLLLSGGFSLLLFTSYSQYCTSGGPSSLIDSNVESVQITGVSGSINYIGCPAVTGVEHYTAESVTLSAGNSYLLTIQFGTCNNNYPGVGEAWIDFNGNGTFEASESILTWAGTPPVAANAYTVTVPANAMAGASRMRVIQAENMTTPMDPCASFTWGSVTDFNVNIIGGIDCSSYTGDTRSDARLISSLPFNESHSTAVCYSNQNPSYNAPDVYYKYVPTENSALTVSLCGSSFDTYLTVLDANGFALAGNDDAAGCGTSSEVQFETTGHDSLFFVVEGWGNASGSYTIDVTSSSLSVKEKEMHALGIYPNPATDKIFLKEIVSGKIEIYDSRGREVLSKEITYESEIDISDLSTGIYIVQFTDQHQTKEQKLIIQ